VHPLGQAELPQVDDRTGGRKGRGGGPQARPANGPLSSRHGPGTRIKNELPDLLRSARRDGCDDRPGVESSRTTLSMSLRDGLGTGHRRPRYDAPPEARNAPVGSARTPSLVMHAAVSRSYSGLLRSIMPGGEQAAKAETSELCHIPGSGLTT
jgi:hypothetical protein